MYSQSKSVKSHGSLKTLFKLLNSHGVDPRIQYRTYKWQRRTPHPNLIVEPQATHIAHGHHLHDADHTYWQGKKHHYHNSDSYTPGCLPGPFGLLCSALLAVVIRAYLVLWRGIRSTPFCVSDSSRLRACCSQNFFVAEKDDYHWNYPG